MRNKHWCDMTLKEFVMRILTEEFGVEYMERDKLELLTEHLVDDFAKATWERAEADYLYFCRDCREYYAQENHYCHHEAEDLYEHDEEEAS